MEFIFFGIYDKRGRLRMSLPPSLITRVFGPAPPPMDGAEVRAARESMDCTVEEMADQIKVLPLEVDAWEAGTIAVTREQAGLIRWQVKLEEHWRRAVPAGMTGCGWEGPKIDSLDQLCAGQAVDLEVATREGCAHLEAWTVHVRDCPQCQRAEQWGRDNPTPDYPGTRGSRIRTALTFAGLLSLIPASIAVVSRGSYPALEPFLAFAVGLWTLSKVVEPTQPLAEKHPFAGALVRAVAVMLPLLVVTWWRGWMDLGEPGVWIAACGIALLAGMGGGLVSVLETRSRPM